DYRAMLDGLRERNTFMLCANPDVVVMRGSDRVYCAGALADLYQHLGGDGLFAGKPHRPIYEAAHRLAGQNWGREAARARRHAIGDGVRTDLIGAAGFGVDFLFIAGGIHAAEFGSGATPDQTALATAFAEAGTQPRALMLDLRW